MKLIKLVTPIFILISLVGCLSNTGNNPPIITEPAATSYFFITNQSTSNLKVTYKIANTSVDSTVSVAVNSTTKILELLRSTFPTPSEAFANLSFYLPSSNITSPIFTIKPIIDKNWNNITAKSDTIRKYELVVTDEDIN
jgi:hypothetical protein